MTLEHTGTTPAGSTEQHIETTERYAAHNYHPLPVVLASGEGAWVTDVDGKGAYVVTRERDGVREERLEPRRLPTP